MGTKKIDIKGKHYGKLHVLTTWMSTAGRKSRWLCMCECGESRVVLSEHLRNGTVTSCKTCMPNKNKSHGLSKSSTYISWSNMIQRCTNPNHDKYHLYGGRGITVDPRWLEFKNFYDDMGDRPAGMTLDKINNFKGYSKDNCRWADLSTQNSNRRPWTRVEDFEDVVNNNQYKPIDGAEEF